MSEKNISSEERKQVFFGELQKMIDKFGSEKEVKQIMEDLIKKGNNREPEDEEKLRMIKEFLAQRQAKKDEFKSKNKVLFSSDLEERTHIKAEEKYKREG